MAKMASENSVTTDTRKVPCFRALSKDLAPQVRLELTTLRLTAECSAIELLRNAASVIIPVSTAFRKGVYRIL